ncbi:MAG: hypothetical protein U0X20_17710 [Caldilineaceae bacterium]
MLPTSGSAQDPRTAANSDLAAQVLAEVLAVEQRWTAAHLAGDFGVLAELMADDYVRISLAAPSPAAPKCSPPGPEHRHWGHAVGDEYDVRIYGDLTGDPGNESGAVLTALVVGRWTAPRQTAASPSTTPPAFSPSTCAAAGAWQMVAEQSTPIS